jgi:phosphohistidine phosphatase
MHRRIVFMRHVSSPHPTGVSDFDRPIDDEGREDARHMARHLDDRDWLPRRVLCSSAKRARETWLSIDDTIDADFEVTDHDELYGAGVETIGEQVWGLPDEAAEVLVVGHNPGWSDTVSWLTGVSTRMPEGSAALVEVDGDDWSAAVQPRSGELVELVRPYEIRQ